MLFSGLIVSPKLSLKDMIAIPISAFEPEETMFQAECEVQETYSVLIEGELDLMQNCERMMGVSYPALLDIFSYIFYFHSSKSSSPYTYMPVVTSVAEVYWIHGVDHADILDL